MDSSSTALGQTLDRWFALLEAQRFRVGVRERLLVQSLLAQRLAQGDAAPDARECLLQAGPLLCTNREQQRRYARLLADFLATAQPAVAGTTTADGATTTTVDEAGSPSAWPRWAAITLVALLGLLLGLWWAGLLPDRTAPKPDIEPPPSAASAPASAVPPVPPASAPSAILPEVYVPSATLPLAPDLAPGWSEPLRWTLAALGVLAAAVLLQGLWHQRRRQVALQGLQTDEALQHHRLHDAEPVDVAPHPTLARSVARALRQRVAGQSRAIDLPATLKATVAAGGAFRPVWRDLHRTPEYLVLIDQQHPSDHHAAYALTLAKALARAGVHLQVWAYDGQPAAGCWALTETGRDDVLMRQRVPIAALATRAAGQRLLVFGEADTLLNAVSGELQPWVSALQPLAQRAWFTPMPMHAWGAAEQAADQAGFLVLPLQEAALGTLAAWLSSGRLNLALDPATPQGYPALLRDEALNWLLRPSAPPDEELDALLLQLRDMLGGLRFQWLCACAVFPALTPPLTLALGRQLLGDNPRALALGLAALSSLPWFRRGRLPDWLRRALLARLSPEQRERLDREVRERLDQALEAGSGPVLADVAVRRIRLHEALRRRRGPLQDVVLADFVREDADNSLAHRITERLRRRLFRDGDPAAGWRLAWAAPAVLLALAGVVAASALWPRLVGTRPQPALPMLALSTSPVVPSTAGSVPPQLSSMGEQLLRIAAPGGSETTWKSSADGQWSAFGFDGSAGLAPLGDRTPDGTVWLVLADGQAQLQDPSARALGAPLPLPAGARLQAAGFMPSGSRVVGLLADGRLISWGRAWPQQLVRVVGCSGQPVAGSLAASVADLVTRQQSRGLVQAEAYGAEAWVRNPISKDWRLPTTGTIAHGDAALAPLAQALKQELAADPHTAGSGWSVQQLSGLDGIVVGACATEAATGTGSAEPRIAGLSGPEQAALSAAVARMFDPDANVRKAATEGLINHPDQLSDAVPLALWRASGAQRGSPGDDGVFNTLVLLQSASALTLNRERNDILALLKAASANGPKTAAQVLNVAARLADAAKRTPQLSIQIVDDGQLMLAQALAAPLQGVNQRVAGIERIGPKAPAATQLRVQGNSDRWHARQMRDALQRALQQPVSLVTVEFTPLVDTYELWLGRTLCQGLTVPGCGTAVPVPAASQPPPARAVVVTPTQAGLDLIAKYEGLQVRMSSMGSLPPFIGYGHTVTAEERAAGRIDLGDGNSMFLAGPINAAQARRLLVLDLQPIYERLAAVVQVALAPEQRDALASYAFNRGLAAVAPNTTLMRTINAGNLAAVPELLTGSGTVVDGRSLPGLQSRRAAEAALWQSAGGAVRALPPASDPASAGNAQYTAPTASGSQQQQQQQPIRPSSQQQQQQQQLQQQQESTPATSTPRPRADRKGEAKK